MIKTFKQTCGAAIGKKLAPPYIILFMADFTYDSFGETPIIWWKYMDNIFFIWKHEEECLKQFSSNNKINTQYSKEHIKFLDLNIRLVDAELMADLFVKPFDSN